MASRRHVALLLAAALLAVLVLADVADAHRRRKKKWKPCAWGKARNYMRCCAKRRCYGTWDPSCPKKGRSCCYLPNRYFWGCCRGKWAAGIYDPACDDDYEWDDDNRPYGRSCASRPRQYRDKCCSEKNPWTDKKACKAWTTGTCEKVSWKYRKQCCYGKWPGTDWYCDYRRWRPDSCASLPPECRDACCASKDPWTDPVACKAWLPWGDCSKCSSKWHRYSCCDNKPWGSPGCNWDDWEDHNHGPIVGASCGSRPPKDRDACCAMLLDPSNDPACKSWWPKQGGGGGGGGGGSCKDVDTRYCTQCCLNKNSKEDPFCDDLLEAKQLSTRAVMAMAIPLADDTATNVTADDPAVADDVPECTQKDFECVDGTSYCLQGEVVDCPDGFQCGTNGTAPASGASQSVCTPGAPTPITPTALDVKAEQPECSVANYTCVSNVTYCFSGQLVDCADGFACSGADPGCAPVAQPAQPEGQPGGDNTTTDPGFTACTEDDNTCLADKTGYCLEGFVVTCEDSTQCSGDAGQATCAPSNTTAPPSPPAPNCTETDFTCINSESSYCLSLEQVDCPPDYKCSGNGEAPCIPKNITAENMTEIIGAPECDVPDFTCVDTGSYCQNKAVVACEGDFTCTNGTSGSNPCTPLPPDPTETNNGTNTNTTACEPNSCIDGYTWCNFEQAAVPCDEGEECKIQDGKPACSVPTAADISPENNAPDAGSPSPAPDNITAESPSPAPESPSPAPKSPSPAPESPSPAPESPSPAPESPSPAPDTNTGAAACSEANTCVNATTWCGFDLVPVACGEGEECNVQEGKPACSVPTTAASPQPEPEVSPATEQPEVSPEVSTQPEVSPEVSTQPEVSPEVSTQPEVSPEVSTQPEVPPEVSPAAEPACPANTCVNDTAACDADGKTLACAADEKCSVIDGKAACALPPPAFSCVPNSCYNETSLCSADGKVATNCTGATEKCFNGTDGVGVCKECNEPDGTCLASPDLQGFCTGGKITKCADGETCGGTPAACSAPIPDNTGGSTGGDASAAGGDTSTGGDLPPPEESPVPT